MNNKTLNTFKPDFEMIINNKTLSKEIRDSAKENKKGWERAHNEDLCFECNKPYNSEYHMSDQCINVNDKEVENE